MSMARVAWCYLERVWSATVVRVWRREAPCTLSKVIDPDHACGLSSRPRPRAPQSSEAARAADANARNAREVRRVTAAPQQHSSGEANGDSGTAKVLGAWAGRAGNRRTTSLSGLMPSRGLNVLVGVLVPRSTLHMPGRCRRHPLDNDPTDGAGPGKGLPARRHRFLSITPAANHA